ncbi:hypothetical protein ABPG72_011144 [Tetrahymena utriculariae]
MKVIDSQKDLIKLLNNQVSQESVNILKIEISNNNPDDIDFDVIFSKIFPNLHELVLNFNNCLLKGDFLKKLKRILEKQCQIQKLFIQFLKVKYQSKNWIQQFIQFVKNTFYNDKSVQFNFVSNSLVLSVGCCHISLDELDIDPSIWIKRIQSKDYIMNISQNQTEFKNIVKKMISSNHDKFKIELMWQNQLICRFSNAFMIGQNIVKLIFQDIDDLILVLFRQRQLVQLTEFFIDIKQIKNLSILARQVSQKMKLRHNFGFEVDNKIIILSFKSENIFKNKCQKQLQECIKDYDLFDQSFKLILNSQFKVQFFKEYILPLYIKHNEFNAYRINLNLKDFFGGKLANINYKSDFKNKKNTIKIDLDNISDAAEIFQSYFDQIQDFKTQKIQIKLFFMKQELSQKFLEQLNKIANLQKQNIVKLSLDQGDEDYIGEYPLIFNIENLKIVKLELKNILSLLDFLQKNRKYFKMNKNNYLHLDIMLTSKLYEGYEQQYTQQILESIKKIYSSDFDRIVSLNIYGVDYFFRLVQDQFLKYLRLSNIYLSNDTYYYIKNKERIDNYNYMDDDDLCRYHVNLTNRVRREYKKYGKAHFAYLLIDHNDDLCRINAQEYCNCDNKKMNKILKQPDEYFFYLFFNCQDFTSRYQTYCCCGIKPNYSI